MSNKNIFLTNKKLISIIVMLIMVLSAFVVISSGAYATGTTAQSTSATGQMLLSTDLGNGNTLVMGSISLTLPNAINKNFTKSPTVSLSPPIKNMPSYVVVGEKVLFTVPSATGGLPPYTYSWKFYNAKGTSYTTATGQSTTHIFNTAGTYKVVAMVTDAVGNIANTTTTVLVYNPLTITSTASSANVIINQPVIYTYSISGGSGVYYLSWNLGNGVIGSTWPYPVVQNPGTITTTYSNPGKYLAVFTVNDSAGMTSRSTYWINVSYAQTNSTMAPLKAYTVINTIPYATSNISSVYIDTEVNDTVYISGGTGTYFVTINWGDGTSTIANNYITVPVVVYNHTYYKPAIYAITVNVTDSLGHNVTTTEFLKVLYKAPEDWLGYYYNATTDSYLSGTAVFPSNNTLTVNVSQASSGIELAGLIKYGELPYSWKLSNVTATLATGTQAYPGIFPLINSTFTKFTTNVPGIYHFGLSVTDNIGNTNTSASLTIIVTPQYLHLVIAPTSESVSIGTTVIFYLTLYNIKLNSTGYANVTFQFNNGTVPTNWTYTHMFKGTPNAILYPYSVGASGYNVPLTNSKVTYKIVGKFTAFGTANYGTTVNTSAAASYNKVSSTITVVPYQAISVTQGTIPYPPVAQVTTPLIVWTNITGGNGYYNITVNASRGMGIVRLPSTYDFGATLTQWGYDNEIYSITNGKYGEISTTPFVPYANITFTIYYTKAGTWSLYGNITNPTGISAFKYPFIIDFHILPPPALTVTMTGSSHFSYASYTTFNLYLNVSGSSLPYTVNMNFGGSLTYLQAYLNGQYITSSSYTETTTNVLELGSRTNSVVGGFNGGDHPEAAVYDPATGLMYIGGPGYINIVNPVNNSMVGSITGVPSGFDMSYSNFVYVPYNGFIYASNYGGSDVLVINTTSNKVQMSINVGAGPQYMAYNPVTNLLYVPNYRAGNNVSVISVVNNTDFESFSLSTISSSNTGPEGVAYDPANNMLYVTLFNYRAIAVMNATTGSIVTTIYIYGYPNDIIYNPSNGFVYATNLYNVTVINTTTNTVQTVIASSNPYSGPWGIAFNPSNNEVYVADFYTSSVWVIKDLTLLASIFTGTGSYPMNLAYDSAIGNMYVVNYNYVPTTVSSFTYTDTNVMPAHFVFVAEYANIPDYTLSNHFIWANVTSSYPSPRYWFENVSYDEYAIPYVQTGIINSTSSVMAPGTISFDATPLFGEFPNMQEYSYTWYLNGILYATTSTSAISIFFTSTGTYTVSVTVTAPNGETATASTMVTVIPSPLIVQVVSVRVDATLLGPSGNLYNAYAGPADWNSTGTVNATFVMPNVPTVNSVYTLNVSYSYTLAVTQYRSGEEAGWYTYYYNAYSATPYASQQIRVIAGGVLVNMGSLQASINGVWNTINVSSSNMANLIQAGFKTVNGNLVTIQIMGSTLEYKMNETNSNISQINGNIAIINTGIGKINTSLQSINAEIVNIAAGEVTLKTSIGFINTTLQSIGAQVTAITGDIAVIQTNLGSVMTSLQNINAKLTSVNGTLATVNTSLGKVTTSLSSIGATVTSINGNVATITTDLGTLNGTVTSINGNVATIHTNLGTLTAEVNGIKSTTSSTSSSVGNTMIFEIVVLVLILVTLVLVAYMIGQIRKQGPKKPEEIKAPEEEKKE